MKTQVERARGGTITSLCRSVANAEGLHPELIASRISTGSIVIMSRGKCCVGIGEGLRTKVNVNIGTSSQRHDPMEEAMKAEIAQRYGADTVSDLSMGPEIRSTRNLIFNHTSLPITTVPIYQTASETGIRDMTGEDIIRTIHEQAKEGVSSFVLHCVSRPVLNAYKKNKRILGIVSKGGSITSAYMLLNRCENPFIEHFRTVLSILKKYDIVLSLGNTMRSGGIHDARDKAQLAEIRENIRLARLAHDAGVQVIIEGVGGHVRTDKIAQYVKYHKRLANFPLFVAGPLPTDVAMGYDHIAGCAGASIASGAGADYLCYITPAEHLSLPTPEQVREGLIAFRIAAHIGDSVKYGLSPADASVSKNRADMDWEGQFCNALDPDKARLMAPRSGPCSMCGDFCAIKIMRELAL
ncbi:MAG: phosphomethylpyrimidine synthase ThiC [Methanoregula sp.]|nr:MAG: phosphomethylpyrimidine synthase ThiC [Methanoregula sp.]